MNEQEDIKFYRPPPLKSQSDSSKKRINNPSSPRDTTPIVVNGNQVSREDITPIVDSVIIHRDNEDEDIDLLENANQVNQIVYSSKSPLLLNSIPDGQEEYEEEADEIQIIDEEEQEQEIVYEQPENYKKFNPPFPEDKTNNQQIQVLQNNLKQQSLVTQPNKLLAQRTAYIQNVESTDASNLSPGPVPKITSPVSTNTVETQSNSRYNSNPIKINNNTIKQKQNGSPQITQSQIPINRNDKVQQTQVQQTQVQQPQPQVMEPEPVSFDDLVKQAHDCFLKYQILQKSWTEYKFPNLDEKLVSTKPQFIIDTYNKSVERIQIDMDVNQYKIALIIMFLGIEVICVKFLGFDAGGYTLSQIKAMNRYEKLLIEIGEKKMMFGGENWPAEVRIIFIGLFNCGLFILMKYLSSVLGPDLVGLISPIVNGLFSGVIDNNKTSSLPDEMPQMPQRQQDFSGMLGSVATMAANALSGNQAMNSNIPSNKQPKASRRPIYRE
jgi:hypothetical protein